MDEVRKGLYFLPLGGAGEIGMNLNLYACDGQWLMADLGIGFADSGTPGVDIIMPDPAWIAERRDDLLGLVLTHGHEDHLGAVAYLWPQLRCPVYATRFAAEILRRKLSEQGLADQVPLTIVGDEPVTLGPFHISMIAITHSIPEARSLAIRTPYGTVLHTGDWKLDDDPQVGALTDAAAYARLGEEGVLAAVCDSTNIFNAGHSGSEADVLASLRRLLTGRQGRVVLTTFSSNIARIHTIGRLAAEMGRHAVLVGRSLLRNVEAARACGYLEDLPPFLTAEDAGYLPREKTLLLCTGCQGEPRGALYRIVEGSHRDVALSPGDTVIFSSKIIPGNERPIGRLINMLVRAGLDVVTEKDAMVHVSGHPGREELTQMYEWLKPRIAVPVHGEDRHIRAHADFARSLGVEQAPRLRNGDLLRLAPEGAEIVAQVPVGVLARDVDSLLDIRDEVLQQRRKIMYNGAVAVSVVLNAAGRLAAAPQVRFSGIPGIGQRQIDQARKDVENAVLGLRASARAADDAVEQAAAQAVRRLVRRHSGRRPVALVTVLRLEDD